MRIEQIEDPNLHATVELCGETLWVTNNRRGILMTCLAAVEVAFNKMGKRLERIEERLERVEAEVAGLIVGEDADGGE